MTAAKDSDHEPPNTDPWIIDGMMPIAIAHAEAAARASDMTIGEWLSQLIAANTSPSSEPTSAAPDLPKDDRNTR